MPSKQVKTDQHTAQQQAQKSQLDVNTDQVPTEIGHGKDVVLSATGEQIVSVGPQPESKPARVGIGQGLLDLHRGLFVICSNLKKSAEARTDITATGHGGTQVEPVKRFVVGECLEQPKAECRGANPATRQRQTPEVSLCHRNIIRVQRLAPLLNQR